MRRDVRNWGELVEAVRELGDATAEPRVIVFHDPGSQTYHFVFGEYGLAKLESDRRGNALYPERFRRSIFGSEEP